MTSGSAFIAANGARSESRHCRINSRGVSNSLGGRTRPPGMSGIGRFSGCRVQAATGRHRQSWLNRSDLRSLLRPLGAVKHGSQACLQPCTPRHPGSVRNRTSSDAGTTTWRWAGRKRFIARDSGRHSSLSGLDALGYGGSAGREDGGVRAPWRSELASASRLSHARLPPRHRRARS